MGAWLLALGGGIAGGVGQAIGALAGKAIQWVPGPQQYRRGKIHELTNQMVTIQNTKPFNAVKYKLLLDQRDKLESDSENTGQ